MSQLANIEPSTIVALTLFVLFALAVEYFTRFFSRLLGLASCRRQSIGPADGPAPPAELDTSGATPPAPVAARQTAPRPDAEYASPAAVPELQPVAASAAIQRAPAPAPVAVTPLAVPTPIAIAAVVPPRAAPAPPPLSHPPLEPALPRRVDRVAPPPPVRTASGTTGSERSAAAILRLVRDLQTLEAASGRAPQPEDLAVPLHDLEHRLSEYSLDDVMEVEDYELGASVVDFYRRVAGALRQSRELLERIPPPALDGAEALGLTDRLELQRLAGTEIARGTRLAQALRRSATVATREPVLVSR